MDKLDLDAIKYEAQATGYVAGARVLDLLAEVRRLQAAALPVEEPRPVVSKVARFRDLAEDLLRKAIRIAEEPSPKWYKDANAKVEAIKALKEIWDKEGAAIAASRPLEEGKAVDPDAGKELALYLLAQIPTPHTEEIEVTEELMHLICAANGGTFDTPKAEEGKAVDRG